jgi:hypothetical protein
VRATRIFYRVTWGAFLKVGRRIENGARREEYLSVYGPLSLLLLLVGWASSLTVGFGLLQYSIPLRLSGHSATLGQSIYVSASSLVMIGGQLPGNTISRWLVTIEAGFGFGLLGLTVGYLPVLYQSYSKRELHISMLDGRAGSPPTAGEFLGREGGSGDALVHQLAKWEEWIAELLEEQLSYPMLAYFRSQHQNQSWLTALTAIVDVSAVLLLCSEGALKHQARLTFAIGRHALVDLTTVFRAQPRRPQSRLPAPALDTLRRILDGIRVGFRLENFTADNLAELRKMYEPYAESLSWHFLLATPAWLPDRERTDNWLATEFDHPSAAASISDPFAIR